MIYKEGRGQNKKELAKKNREIVRMWFEANPTSTITECIKSTSLSYPTVRKHIDAIQRGE